MCDEPTVFRTLLLLFTLPAIFVMFTDRLWFPINPTNGAPPWSKALDYLPAAPDNKISCIRAALFLSLFLWWFPPN